MPRYCNSLSSIRAVVPSGMLIAVVLARQRLSIRRGMCPAEDGRDTARKVDGACGTEARNVDGAWWT